MNVIANDTINRSVYDINSIMVDITEGTNNIPLVKIGDGASSTIYRVNIVDPKIDSDPLYNALYEINNRESNNNDESELITVALKVALPVKHENLRFLFKMEIDVYSQCHHPNIIHLIWSSLMGGTITDLYPLGAPFLVLESMEGCLSDLLKNDTLAQAINPNISSQYNSDIGGLIYMGKERMNMIKSVALGLQYMHGKGWAHMDITLTNVLYKVVPNGRYNVNDSYSRICNYLEPKHTFVFKICDMGLAVHKDNMKYYSPGTNLYMDLNAFNNITELKFENAVLTDIWSLGIVSLSLICEYLITVSIFRKKGLDIHKFLKGEIEENVVKEAMTKLTQEDFFKYLEYVEDKYLSEIIVNMVQVDPMQRKSIDWIVEHCNNVYVYLSRYDSSDEEENSDE